MRHPEPVCAADAESTALTALQSDDDAVRARSIGALCPCRVGHAVFERHLGTVSELTHDPSPAVRKAALHVFEDAFEMQNAGYPTNPREVGNEMLRRKRASRFARDESEIEVSKRDPRDPRGQRR